MQHFISSRMFPLGLRYDASVFQNFILQHFKHLKLIEQNALETLENR